MAPWCKQSWVNACCPASVVTKAQKIKWGQSCKEGGITCKNIFLLNPTLMNLKEENSLCFERKKLNLSGEKLFLSGFSFEVNFAGTDSFLSLEENTLQKWAYGTCNNSCDTTSQRFIFAVAVSCCMPHFFCEAWPHELTTITSPGDAIALLNLNML